MEGIKYVNLMEIGPVVIGIRGVENGKLAIPVNNTSVCNTAFLAADTQPCVLIGECHRVLKSLKFFVLYHRYNLSSSGI